MRGSPAPWIWPKVPLLTVDTGLFKFTWFGKLNASPRNCSEVPSRNRKLRVTARSRLNTPGPLKLLYPRFPYVPAAAGLNAPDVIQETQGVWMHALRLLRYGFTSERRLGV